MIKFGFHENVLTTGLSDEIFLRKLSLSLHRLAGITERVMTVLVIIVLVQFITCNPGNGAVRV